MENNKKYKIFLVDKDAFLLDMYKLKLEQNGFNVTLSKGAKKDFVNMVYEIKPDAVIMEVISNVGDYDGFEALKMLKDDKRTKDIPFIFLTNVSEKDRVNRAIKLGAVDYIVKANFTPAEIVKIVNECLANPKEYKPRYFELMIELEKIENKDTQSNAKNIKSSIKLFGKKLLKFLFYFLLVILGIIFVKLTGGINATTLIIVLLIVILIKLS